MHDDDDDVVAQHGGYTPKTRHTTLLYRVLLWYFTSILQSIDTWQNKVSADQYNLTISRAQVYSSSRSQVSHVFVKLTKCWFSDWIAGSCQVNLLKKGQDCSDKCFLLLCFVYMVIFESQNKRQKNNLTTKLQNSNHNSTFSWISLIGLWTTRPRSFAFRLA